MKRKKMPQNRISYISFLFFFVGAMKFHCFISGLLVFVNVCLSVCLCTRFITFHMQFQSTDWKLEQKCGKNENLSLKISFKIVPNSIWLLSEWEWMEIFVSHKFACECARKNSVIRTWSQHSRSSALRAKSFRNFQFKINRQFANTHTQFVAFVSYPSFALSVALCLLSNRRTLSLFCLLLFLVLSRWNFKNFFSANQKNTVSL